MSNVTNVINALEDLKAQDITVLNISKVSSFADYMLISTGTSKQHVRSIASHVYQTAKHGEGNVLGIEGQETGEWVLIDLGNIIVHVMLQSARDYYQLEKLWDISEADESSAD